MSHLGNGGIRVHYALDIEIDRDIDVKIRTEIDTK